MYSYVIHPRALEVVVTFDWRRLAVTLHFSCGAVILVCGWRGDPLPRVEKICSVHVKVIGRVGWQWWDFVTHDTSLWLVEALCGKWNTVTGSVPWWSSNMDEGLRFGNQYHGIHRVWEFALSIHSSLLTKFISSACALLVWPLVS